jgi:hypothetical protein
VSEFVQSMLPVKSPPACASISLLTKSQQYKQFQFGDVFVCDDNLVDLCVHSLDIYQANLLGSAIGLSVSYHLEQYYRHRREVGSFTSTRKQWLTISSDCSPLPAP